MSNSGSPVHRYYMFWDFWRKLENTDKTNQESVSTTQSSVFTLCLDGKMPPAAEENYHTWAANQILHGGGSQWNTGNRWLDKTLQVGMEKRCSLMNHCHLVKPVSVTRITGRYLTHQKGLPTLPVLPLQQTCERYIAALEPILEVEELKHTKELVADFQKAGGVGERLQRSLEMKAHNTENLFPECMDQDSFLQYRMPVVVYSSPGCVFPRMNFNNKTGQLRFAAKLIAGVLDFKTMVDNETLPVEYLGGKPLCMNQYYDVMSSCRVPGLETDSLVKHARSSSPPQHITVVHNNEFFPLDVYKSKGSSLTADQLYLQLERICKSSAQRNMEPVGILTSLHRDCWARTYLNLVKDKTNKESVSAIQRSIFMLCLDGAMRPVTNEMYRDSAVLNILHGGGSQWNSGNRWFDKTLQFIVGEDGTCGLCLEHTPADGTPVMALIDHAVEYTKKQDPMWSPIVPQAMPHKLHFNLTPEIKKDIVEAKSKMNIVANDLEMRVNVFGHYGKKVPKAHSISPDAFIQMAIQLAYYRMLYRCCFTQESASMRMFRLGRTEVIRSASNASAAFVKAFDDPSKKNTEKVDLLVKAVQAHRLHIDMVISGQSIDRHLLGLQMMVIEEQLSIPDIFADPAYAKAMHFHIYSSQVHSKTDCIMFYGPVVPDGYSVCYSPKDDPIDFAVGCLNSCEETNAAHLAQAMEDSLLDMRTLLEQCRQ